VNKPKILARKIPILGAAPIVLAFGACLYSFDNYAAEAKVQTKAQGVIWNNADCLQCHTDALTLKRMQDKRGDASYCQAAYDELTKAGKKSKNWANSTYTK
jgi:hypothetical protein